MDIAEEDCYDYLLCLLFDRKPSIIAFTSTTQGLLLLPISPPRLMPPLAFLKEPAEVSGLLRLALVGRCNTTAAVAGRLSVAAAAMRAAASDCQD